MVFDIGTVLLQWQSAGVFDYILPFLLVFAVVFGILNTTSILGKHKGVNVVIALVIGLMALQLDLVPAFFREIFPRLGIGIAVLLTLLILVGLFIPGEERRYWGWGLGAIGVIVAITVIAKSFENYGWYSTGNYGDYIGWVVLVVLVIGIIIAIGSAGGSAGNSGTPDTGKGVATYPAFRTT